MAILCVLDHPGYTQGVQTHFGQNRVQYQSFEWLHFDSKNFRTYYYQGGNELAKYTIQEAESSLSEMLNKLEFSATQKMEIMVFNTYDDFLQSNIDLESETFNGGGTARLSGNKIFVYFDGNHAHIMHQLRKGIATRLIAQMIWGGNFQDVILNGLLLNIPEWFIKGLTNYLTEDWNTVLDNDLRYKILHKEIKNFDSYASQFPETAGHSLWHYIALTYGENAIPNMLYITRINHNIHSGFSMGLGANHELVKAQWLQYFTNVYNNEYSDTDTIRLSKNTPISTKTTTRENIVPHPLNKGFAYLQYRQGKWKVILQHIDKKKTTVKKGGVYQLTNELINKPCYAFSPGGNMLSIVYRNKNKIYLLQYDIAEEKKTLTEITKFQQIHSIAYGGDNNTLLLSATQNGVSDIYTYQINTTNVQNLTNDFYDDLQPSFFKSGNNKGILFISNRTTDSLKKEKLDTILPNRNFGVWYYNLKNPSQSLIQISPTNNAQCLYPMQWDSTHLVYLSDESGVFNRYITSTKWDSVFVRNDITYFFKDSIVVNPNYNIQQIIAQKNIALDSMQTAARYRYMAEPKLISDREYNIAWQQTHPKCNTVFETIRIKNSTQNLQIEKKGIRTKDNKSQTSYAKLRDVQEENNTISKKELIDFLVPEFESEIDTNRNNNKDKNNEYSKSSKPKFRLQKAIPYHVSLQIREVSTQLDNTILFNQYQLLNPNGVSMPFQNPNLSGFIRFATFDLMEDHRFFGGLKFPIGLNGTEYFIMYQYLKKRIDYKFLFHKKAELQEYRIGNTDVIEAYKQKNYFTQFQASYPFSRYHSVRTSLGIRWDKVIDPSRYINTPGYSFDYHLRSPSLNYYWSFLKTEWVFDQSVNPALNIWKGIRAKFYHEFYVLINGKNKNINVLGFDARHYKPIYKNIIIANRFSGASSFGKSKIVYFMGGTDNQINLGGKPIFDTDNIVDPNFGYNYQALATHLRGFMQNARNGNNYLLFNSELRIPIFQTIRRKPIQSGFMRNLQGTLFLDAGSVWKGTKAFNNDAPPSYLSVGSQPVILQVNYYKSPIIFGYGSGLRTTLFGFFLRFDVAWAWDSGFLKNGPKYYFSFGTDF